jgi:hypothetical protein
MSEMQIKYVKTHMGWRCNLSIDYVGQHLYATRRGQTKADAYRKAYRKLSSLTSKAHKAERKRRKNL